MNDNAAPFLDVYINLDELVAREVEKAGLQDSLITACESTIQETMTTLGIPGITRVKIFPEIPPEWTPALIGVTANDQSLISLPGGENRLLAVTLGRLLQPGEGGPALPAWLVGQIQSAVAGQDNPGVSYLASLAQKILTANPAILFGSEQADALRHLLSGADAKEPLNMPADPDWLIEIARTLLQAHISLSNLDHLAAAIRQFEQTGAVQAAEGVLTALLPQTFGLQVPQWLLEAYTLADDRLDRARPEGVELSVSPFTLFAEVRKDLFTFHGLNLPALEFEVYDSRKQSFSFRINNLAGQEWPALPAETALVDAQPEQIALWGVEAVPALHPEDGRLCSLVNETSAAHLTENGFVAWHGMHYLALCFASQVSGSRGALVHNQAVEVWLDKMNELSPELVKAVQEEFGGQMQAVLTRTLRRLVERDISMNLLPRILDELLNTRVLPLNAETHIIIGSGMPVPPEVAASDWRSDPQILADYVIRSIA